VVGAAAAFALNPLFGGFAALALVVSASTYALENGPPERRAARAAAIFSAVGVALLAVALSLPRTAGGGIVAYALQGFFSWRPAAALVLLTLAYLASSYLFLLRTRDLRDPLKYASVYLFVYAQGWLLYFYWSGLENHFWPALPYLGLHVLVMVRLMARSGWTARHEAYLLLGIALALGAVIGTARDTFVSQRDEVSRIFSDFETHAWPFPRARVVSTVDPAPIAATLAQLERYSTPGERGVCMLSVLDGMLPFLAGRHSIFPHFDLQWAIVTERDRRRMLEVIERARPKYVFVGREVETADELPLEPCGIGMDDEEESARGRIAELRRLFDAVSAGYERVEVGPLLSVYRRRDGGEPWNTSRR
jgi:hypothetical protein